MDKEWYFFRKDNTGFFLTYKNCNDFDFIYKKELSKYYIVKIVKRYIHMQNPKIWSSTLMATTKKGILKNPNYMYGTFILEDNNLYTIIKRYDTIKIFLGEQNKFAFDDEKPYIEFKLDEDKYDKALQLQAIKRNISLVNGKIDIKDYEKFIKLYKELDEFTKII